MKATPRRYYTELAFLVVLIALALNWQWLADQYALATFHPAAPMQAIINRLQLTPQAKGVLYSARAQVDSAAAFNRDCQVSGNELELGCYTHGRIYVLQITNPSLASEMTVTTAHELLHAEWARLGSAPRKSLGDQLETVYRGLHDASLAQRMASYSQSEPGEETNELHSILGTEYSNLTPTLEKHYRQYFLSRGLITAAQQKYQGVFAQRRDELNAELAQVTSLKAQLSLLEGQMAADKAMGAYAAYNALVPRQNALASQVNGLIDDYNAGVGEYNALANSLDSSKLAPASR